MEDTEVKRCPKCGAELKEGVGIAKGYWHCESCDYVEKQDDDDGTVIG